MNKLLPAQPALLTLLALLAFELPFAACGGEPKTPTKDPVADGAGKDHQGDHGTLQPLGNLTIGAHAFQVLQEGGVAAGKEAAFDVEFPAGKPLPAAMRVWIGIESGAGSMKTKFLPESARVLHGHVEVPKVLPEGSRLWLEIEENGATAKASLTWK